MQRLLLCFVALLCIAADDLPDGGTPLIDGPTVEKLEVHLPDPDMAEVVVVDVDKDAGGDLPPDAKAFRVQTIGQPSNPWDIQLQFFPDKPIKRGDVLHARFYMRCAESMTGSGTAGIVFQLNRDGYDTSVNFESSTAGAWKRIDVPFIAGRDFDAGDSQICINTGFSNQTVDIAGVEVLHYGDALGTADLPKTPVSYSGREDDAAWRQAALEHIEQIRTADLTVRVVDAAGNPVEGVRVEIDQTRNAFAFGSAVVANRLAGTEPADDWYRDIVDEFFNEVVFENDLKWPFMEFNDFGVSKPADIDAALSWLDQHDKTVRGHVLVWPGWPNLPERLQALADEPEKLRAEIYTHVRETVTTHAGRIDEWDALNEPFNNHDVMDILGDEVMAEWFEAADEAATAAGADDTKWYINDWGILAAGGSTNTPHHQRYYEIIQMLLNAGAPIDGVGVQGHFGYSLTAPETQLAIYDRIAEFGLAIKVTEYDLDVDDDQLQADFLRDTLIAAYSHEDVDGFLVWGFYAGNHWRPRAAMFDEDYQPRNHAHTWRELVLDQWHTDMVRTTDDDGLAQVRGHLGTYDITVTLPDGTTKTRQIELTRDGADITMN
ncbi:MAG: endo-1,4-beta-xylanase [Planctomycetota bacterium]